MRVIRRADERGLTLIELMVSLAIGSLLIVGAITVYSQSQNTYRVSDRVARLQENARYVLSIMEPDLQLAGYYGFANRADTFNFISGGNTGSGISVSGLTPTSTPVPLSSDVDACGPNFVLNLAVPVESSQNNNQYGPLCKPTAPIEVRAGTDSLTVRHASIENTSAAAGRVQLIASRLSPGGDYIFADGTVPSIIELVAGKIEVRNLIVRTYYIATNTDRPSNPPVPSLRVRSLVPGPSIMDEEVMSGVEDLQVQFGIAPLVDTDADGLGDSPVSSAVTYVDTVQPGFQIVSVRIWLLMRADRIEQGFIDNRAYQYAGNAEFTRNDGYRRVLVSRTIQLRNARAE